MSIMKVHILRCGTVHLATGRSPFAPRVMLPVWCYLVEHPSQGLLLVDTGLGTQPLGPFLTWHYHCEPGPSIVEQLNNRGIAPEELDTVILSDLDIDHTGGVHELRAAKRFLVSEEEYFWTPRTVFAVYQPRSLWENDVKLEAFYLRGVPWGPARYALDLFGDGSVVSVLTKGHTFGSCTTMLIWNGKCCSRETPCVAAERLRMTACTTAVSRKRPSAGSARQPTRQTASASSQRTTRRNASASSNYKQRLGFISL